MAMDNKERFTMLLLDPGEILFEDYSVSIKMPESQWLDGRLKLCSKSLVFVSRDVSQPLIKIQFQNVTRVEKDEMPRTNVLNVDCKQYVEMLEGNVLAPYKFVHKPVKFQFLFNYAEVDDLISQMQQLLRAATLSAAEQNAMIMTIVHSRQSRFLFDTSWLEDLYEQVICELQANKVLPLIINPGRILLSTSRLYFQPYNNMDQHPVLKINLKDVKSLTRRRFLLRQVGLEIKWAKSSQAPQVLFLATTTQEERDTLYSKILEQPVLQLESVPQNHMTMQWQNGSLSNYDYLLYINSLADRTFHDLTQYPVMPWILQDYSSSELDLNEPAIYRDLSKPIGALEPARLERLKARYAEMTPPKFLYGSHYSAPGFVLFYLVRKYPQYMLCLQNGRFDHPDRMFNSVADVWKNVLTNMSDFKELIPEFYDTDSRGDFLVNNYGIDFGFRHDGTKNNHVELPAWSNGPSDFVRKLRCALESSWVSENLHHWIDLIFGFKQRGREALEADNVFFHLCYEGSIDLDTIRDINDRHGLEVQINEFGQIPKQVFASPHPRRLTASRVLDRELCFARACAAAAEPPPPTDEPLPKLASRAAAAAAAAGFQSHKEAVSAVTGIPDEDKIVSVSHDGVLKIHCLESAKLSRSVALSAVSLSCCVHYRAPDDSSILAVGSCDNSIIFYDIEFGKVFHRLRGHEDAVSCLAYGKVHDILVSGSWDSTVKVWHSVCPAGKRLKPADCFIAGLDHDSPVTCIGLSTDETLLASGTCDGEISLYSLADYDLRFTISTAQNCKVNSLLFDAESRSLVSCASNGSLSVIDVQTSTQTFFITLDAEPSSLAWIRSFLLIGDSKGHVRTWNPRTAKFSAKSCCHDGTSHLFTSPKNLRAITFIVFQGAVVSLVVLPSKSIAITGGLDKRVLAWSICDC